MVEQLRTVGVHWPEHEAAWHQGGPLVSKRLVVTGILPSLTRYEAKALLEAAGGKLAKAQQLNVTILDEAGLRALLEREYASASAPTTGTQDELFQGEYL